MLENPKRAILLVEDEAILAIAEKMELEKYGYVVNIVNTGEKAVEAVKTMPDIDLVLMDINLGNGIDGTQAAEIILKDHDIPIVFVSSHSEREVVEKTERITSYGYVIKNSSFTILDASIKMVLKLFQEKKNRAEKEVALREREDRLSKIMMAENDGMWDWNIQSTTEELQEQNEKLILSGQYLRQSEACLQDSVDKFNLLLNSVTEGIYGVDENENCTFCNDSCLKLLGYTHQDQLLGKNMHWLMHGKHSDGSVYLIEDCPIAKNFRKGIGIHIDDEVFWRSDNSCFHAEYWSNPQILNGKIIGAVMSFVDITKRKRAEEALLESEERFKKLSSFSFEGIIIHKNLIGVDVNESMIKLLGYERNEIIGMNLFNVIHPDYHEIVKNNAVKQIATPYQIVVVRKDGSFFDADIEGKNISYNGEHFRVACIRDITERKKTEVALKESQERLKFALEVSSLGEWELNLKTNTIKRNDRWAEMLGYSLAEIDDSIQQGVDLQHPDDREIVSKAVQDYYEGRADYFKINYRMKTKDGSYKWIQDCGKTYERDADGKPIRLCGTHTDIDEQKKAEDVIRTTNNLLSSILESSPDVIVFALDSQYQYIAFNSKHKAVIQHIWGKEIALGMNMLEIIGSHEDGQKAKENFDRALAGESFVVVEDYGDEELSRQSWLDYWSPIKAMDGKVIGLTCFVLNNTEQKKAETKIKALLAEKELILKEVHHRIKNNMNTISSLLSLQAGTIAEPEAIKALVDAGSRIHCMSLLYDKLYRSVNFDQLSVKEYLNSLVDDVVENFPDSQIVKIEKNLMEFRLNTKKAQSMGIIINELLTNILKYAFKGRKKGLIVVAANSSNGHATISVEDDGIGMPETVSFKNSTGFGLQLIQALTQQMNGTIRIERGNGTRIVLEFEL